MAGPPYVKQGSASKEIANRTANSKPMKAAPLTAANDASRGAGPKPDRSGIGTAVTNKRPTHYTVHFEDGSSTKMDARQFAAYNKQTDQSQRTAKGTGFRDRVNVTSERG